MVKQRRKQKTPQASQKKARTTLDLAWKENTDEHIASSDDESENEGREPRLQEEESEAEEKEALDVKRVRLAREYLDKLEEASDSASSAASDEESEDDQDHISRKLQRERLKREGTLERILADKVGKHVEALQTTMLQDKLTMLPSHEAANLWVQSGNIRLLHGHDLTPTSVAVDASGKVAVSGSKDNSVIVWDVETGSPLHNLYRHWKQNKEGANKGSRNGGEVLAVSLSDDGRYAVVGKRDSKVIVFDLKSNNPTEIVKTFEGHKGPISCLAFQSYSHRLFSSSEDRCIRHYSLDDMLYMETLYGHQFAVSGIDCHRKERPVSVGRDRTARAWKLAEDSHLIFRGGSKIQSADCVSLIKDDWFITGHEDGHLCLWNTDKKRAVSTIADAHGTGNPLVSVSALKESDLAASGSKDGFIRLWKVRTGKTLEERGMELLVAIPVRGYVNAIRFGPKARFLVAAIGQEHRCGRWDRVKGVKNRVAIVNLFSGSEAIESEMDGSKDNAQEHPSVEENEEPRDASEPETVSESGSDSE
ncbi:ribosomal RNA-processing protein 9 [Fistulifera solaris]|uniref:Ribosomal RNA-processing protein 9 n=1 Tax=Fistulifera solaris TaxID=1519565 RepID=A0A1Z5KEA6_FISSO|nr:ribosomal RNA-processing protein 9 [Fistulifera solaris]|eukprot:GAX24411.1 ribosomal RNA-processing protein 9 [Fistulifera solaris]